MSKDCRLTTFDNPFDPFEQFDLWNLFDVEKGYNTCCYLATLTQDSDEMTEKEEMEEKERVIDSIIKHDIFNIYKKVYRNETNSSEKTINNTTDNTNI